MARRQCGDVVAEEHDPPGARLRRAGDQIEQRGLAGAVRADQAEHLAGAHLEAHLIDGGQRAEPLGGAVDPQHGSIGDRRARAAGERRGGDRRDRLRPRQKAADHRHDAAARLLQDDDQQHAEEHHFELRAVARDGGKHVLQHVLEQDDDRCADHGAGDLSGAADQRHEQKLDARADVERRRIHEPLHMRIEPAGKAGEHAGENEDREPHAEAVDREAFHHGNAAAQAADGAALP